MVDNFKFLDANNDGSLSQSEFSVVFADSNIFQQLDLDHDGYITESELIKSVDGLSQLENN